ncbi:MAG TPA: penicillin-binding protein 1C [Verrucomicrobiales bacterium]|nr:penicillin-binding protein 1C [Verrucomicrobiales bacterium]
MAMGKTRGTAKRSWARKAGWGMVALAVLWIVLVWVVPALLPFPESLRSDPPPAPVYTDREGTPLRRLMSGEAVRSLGPLELEEAGEALRTATVAAEDRRFWRHGGVDCWALLRAARDWARHGRVVSGASTITQQLVKLSAPPARRTLATKAKEMLRARRVEMAWSKERILEAYLNRLDYGNSHWGCRAAAEGYFGKPAGDLSLAESAFLAGLPQSPARLDPYRHFEAAKTRQGVVLDRIARSVPAWRERVERARREELRLAPRSAAFEAPHVVDYLLQRRIPKQGETLRTTLDLAAQRAAEGLLRRHLAPLEDRRVGNGAIVALDTGTGEVLALVGSRDYFDPEAGQVNGALAPRSPGSVLKPFTYLLGIEAGFGPAAILADVPVEFMTPTGIYQPHNYGRTAAGPVSVRQALANSLNIPAVRLLERVGGAEVLRRFLRGAGIGPLDREADHYGLGLTLGNAPVRLLDVTAAYAGLGRLGRFGAPRFFLDELEAGETLQCRPGAAWLIGNILADDGARVPSFGLRSCLDLPFPAAVKTGTSSDFRDNWVVGYTPRYTVGVWVGNFDGGPMRGVSGVTGAGPLFHDLMLWLHEDEASDWPEAPPGVAEVVVDRRTGKRLAEGMAAPVPMKHRRREWALREFLPEAVVAEDYDAEGRAWLDPGYGQWWASLSRKPESYRLRQPRDAGPAALQIAFPLPGTVVYLEKALPFGGRRVPLRVGNGEKVDWTSDSAEIVREEDRFYAEVSAGRHRFRARDRGSGEEATTWIRVVGNDGREE